MSSLVEYEPFVDECAAIFDQQLQELSQSGLPVNMGYRMQCCAFDVTGCITYSKRLGFLDQRLNIAGITAAIENGLAHATLVGVYPLFRYVFDYSVRRMEEHEAAAKVVDEDEKPAQGMARDFVSIPQRVYR
ncbi:hypothetical protein F5B19DRAFT_495782 [Rostrohypoxylon terebratum]|nr:hypothetical protein F5B19DRAFT_495782 [Rostrohypoxylon terebratum]